MAAEAMAPVSVSNTEWGQSQCSLWALETCTACKGNGSVDGPRKRAVCRCVYRGCFRAVMARFERCRAHIGTVQAHAVHARGGRYITCGRPNEEFIADVLNTARRALPEQILWRVFDLHMLQGMEWTDCCRRTGLDRGSFFHAVYRIEHRLGRVFRETEPYSLIPSEYFSGGRTINLLEMARSRTSPELTHRSRRGDNWMYMGEHERTPWTTTAHPWRATPFKAGEGAMDGISTQAA